MEKTISQISKENENNKRTVKNLKAKELKDAVASIREKELKSIAHNLDFGLATLISQMKTKPHLISLPLLLQEENVFHQDPLETNQKVVCMDKYLNESSKELLEHEGLSIIAIISPQNLHDISSRRDMEIVLVDKEQFEKKVEKQRVFIKVILITLATAFVGNFAVFFSKGEFIPLLMMIMIILLILIAIDNSAFPKKEMKKARRNADDIFSHFPTKSGDTETEEFETDSEKTGALDEKLNDN